MLGRLPGLRNRPTCYGNAQGEIPKSALQCALGNRGAQGSALEGALERSRCSCEYGETTWRAPSEAPHRAPTMLQSTLRSTSLSTPISRSTLRISKSETWVPKRGGLKPAGKRQESATFPQRSDFDVAAQFFVCCSAALKFGTNDVRTAEKRMLQCSFCSAAFQKLQRNFRFHLWHVAGGGV